MGCTWAWPLTLATLVSSRAIAERFLATTTQSNADFPLVCSFPLQLSSMAAWHVHPRRLRYKAPLPRRGGRYGHGLAVSRVIAPRRAHLHPTGISLHAGKAASGSSLPSTTCGTQCHAQGILLLHSLVRLTIPNSVMVARTSSEDAPV